MSPWLKKLVLVAALLVMPLQGVAATLSVVFCHGEAQVHAGHAYGGEDPGMHQYGRQNEGGATDHVMYHPCCHSTVTAPLAVTLPAAAPDFPVQAIEPDPLHDLFVPDRPQRPPLA